MTNSQQQIINLRREKVLELSSRGLTQEIAAQLGTSQKTISNDLEWLRRDAIEFVHQNREHVALGYRKVMSNLYQLKK
jgi:transcriptional regulator